jgi:alanine-glyoxylate transaminase/serine-glyoxylate transaminase/serine-pyruvate transaminase
MIVNKQWKLMIPGPVQPENSVLEAMGKPVQAHYGPEWRDFYNLTTGYLKRVFATEGDVHIIVGSGSSGIDACLGSALSTGEKILIGINGFFGERLRAIAEGYGLVVIPVECPYGETLQVANFEDSFAKHPDAVAVAVVHLETSTTIINPIEPIGKFAHSHGLYYIVDTVSSLGGLPFRMDEWGIDLCASSSQKCLGAPPGLAPVAVGKRGWDAIDRNPQKGHGWYLNLRTWRQYAIEWADWHPYPVTLATNNIVALHTSLEHLIKEGIENRLERYTQLARRLRNGLHEIGMSPYTPDEQMCPVLTAAYGPPGVPTGQIVSYLAEKHRIKIAGGLGVLKDKVFRIGHMSPSTTQNDIDTVVEALRDFVTAHSL